MRSPRSRSGRGLRCVLVALVLATACSGGSGPVTAPTPPPPTEVDPLREAAGEKGSVLVIVDLAVPPKPDGTWDQAEIAAAQRKLLADLGKGVTVTARYETTPQLGLELEQRALKKLRASPLVLAIHLNETDETTEE